MNTPNYRLDVLSDLYGVCDRSDDLEIVPTEIILSTLHEFMNRNATISRLETGDPLSLPKLEDHQ